MADLVTPTRGHGLVEILDRVLDKGLVIAGDIKVNLANVELLTIQVRLLICSIDHQRASMTSSFSAPTRSESYVLGDDSLMRTNATSSR